MSLAETASVLTDAGARVALMASARIEYEPQSWTDSAAWSFRVRNLKQRYERRGAMPKRWADIAPEFIAALDPDVRAFCEEALRLGDEQDAIRRAFCGKLASVWMCSECGRPGKRIAGCKLSVCAECAPRNFDALFRRFLEVENLISPAVRSLPGWTWHVLDFSFWHDRTHLPTRRELRAMVAVIRRVVQRAIAEAVVGKSADLYRARRGCRLRFNEDGTPIISRDGWPIASAVDGSMRELIGWTVVYFPQHQAPDNAARTRGERGAKKTVPEKWALRFGAEFLRVREFGCDNTNAHFHGAYFGPPLDYWKGRDAGHLVCGGRLVEIFKEETRRPLEDGGLGRESYTVFFEPARRGYRSVLAHALKYTKKIPRTTPEGLAQLGHAGKGTRRVALLGAHYGVPLKPKPRKPKCSSCGSEMERVEGLGLVPLDAVVDLPEVAEPVEDCPSSSDADDYLELEVRGP